MNRPIYVVELHPGVWLAPWSGDPGRTLRRESAKEFEGKHAATCALNTARRYREFPKAVVKLRAP